MGYIRQNMGYIGLNLWDILLYILGKTMGYIGQKLLDILGKKYDILSRIYRIYQAKLLNISRKNMGYIYRA